MNSHRNDQPNASGSNVMNLLQEFAHDFGANHNNNSNANKDSMQEFPSCSSFGDMASEYNSYSNGNNANATAADFSHNNKRRISEMYGGEGQTQQAATVRRTVTNGNGSSPTLSSFEPNAITSFLQQQLKAMEERKQKKRQRLVSQEASSASWPGYPSHHDQHHQAQQQQQGHAMMQVQHRRLPSGQQGLAYPQAPQGQPQQAWRPVPAVASAPQALPPQAHHHHRQAPPAPPAQQAQAAAQAPPSTPDGLLMSGNQNSLDTKYYLHRVCRHFASKKEVVEIALALDPQAVRRKLSTKPGSRRTKLGIAAPANTSSSSGITKQHHQVTQERYSFPINIALQNNASMDVLELLVKNGPDVMSQSDGFGRMGTLSVALCQKPRDSELIDLILYGNLQGIMVTDRKLSYPLHIACAKGASLEVIQRLYSHYPAALFQQNFNSETPLDIARRSSMMDEEALNFLFERFNDGCSMVANHSFQQNGGSIACAAAPGGTLMAAVRKNSQVSA